MVGVFRWYGGVGWWLWGTVECCPWSGPRSDHGEVSYPYAARSAQPVGGAFHHPSRSPERLKAACAPYGAVQFAS